MKIDSSFVGMESARSYTSWTKRSVATRIVEVASAKQGSEKQEGMFSDLLETKTQDDDVAKASSTENLQGRFGRYENKISSIDDKKTLQSIRQQCVMYLIKWLYDSLGGKKLGREDTSYQNDTRATSFERQLTDAASSSMNVSSVDFMTFNGGLQKQRNLEIQMNYSHVEQEQTSFASKGYVKTADGREIAFNMDISMSRRFEEYYQSSSMIENVKMMDPLVINLDGNITGLSDQKFEFDLDCDGIKESISTLNNGNGFLALDQNGDGIINDGSELFGTKSGDGFADLSKYDEDGNGWIDENDAVFDKLLIWAKTETGKDELYTLKEAGVGAICLQRANTEFSLNSLHDNQVNGKVRSTGMFLYENGNVGVMQQLDLAQ